MSELRLKADFTFDAEDLDDACLKLIEHFKYILGDIEEDPQLIKLGSISIKGSGDYNE